MSRKSLATAVVATGLVSAVLAGCGSSTGGNPASATRTASADAQDPQSTITAVPTTAAPSDAASAAPEDSTAAVAPTTAASVAPAGAGALPGVPAVSNATDLTKQPIAAAGTGSAPTGLVTRDLVVGSGTPAVSTDTVSVKYAGTIYATGKSFDASWTDGAANQTASFSLAEVVPGFADGIVGMKPGGRREIVIPPALGYGAAGQAQAGISGTDTLVFIVDYKGVGTS